MRVISGSLFSKLNSCFIATLRNRKPTNDAQPMIGVFASTPLSKNTTFLLAMKTFRALCAIAVPIPALLAILATYIGSGCASNGTPEAQVREPRSDGRIKTVRYDQTHREPKRDVSVFHGEAPKPVNAIAYFTAEAKPTE